MQIVWKIAAAVVGVALLGAVGFLAVWDIPAPRQPVERVLPNDRFPR